MNPGKIITAYLTKRCLEAGKIEEAQVEECETKGLSKPMVSKPSVRDECGRILRYPECFSGNDWHLTKAEAIAHAKVKRDNKIKSLEKSIAKLKALKFD
jgi:hypothetical protein